MKRQCVLGIDIGGSGVKGAIVDIKKGEFYSDRIRIPTPSSHTPQSILGAVKQIVDSLEWNGIIGCGFPGVIRSQIIETAANLGGENFIGVNFAQLIESETSCPTWIVNDADAAGIAEIQYGAGKNRKGVVLMLTVGTGIGVSMFVDGVLVPNLELGHLKMRDKKTDKNVSAEKLYSDAARKRADISWKQWIQGFNKYLEYVNMLCRPDLILIGGGVAGKSEKFLKYIKCACDIEIAQLQNKAGIIGSAYLASQKCL